MPILRYLRRNREPVGLLEMPVAVRDQRGCDRHRFVSGEFLSKWFTACSSGCTHLMGKAYHRLTRRVAICLLFVLTLAHPFLHALEGGALDAVLVGLIARASWDD